MELFAEVVLPLPMKGTFTYEVPVQERSAIQRGCRVLVPFGGKKIYTGIVFALHNDAPTEYHAKAILSVLDQQPILSAQHLNFGNGFQSITFVLWGRFIVLLFHLL